MNNINSNNTSLTESLQKNITTRLRTFLVNPLKLKIAKWSQDEDEKLKNIVQEKGSRNWKKIAEYFENKSALQCFYRYNRIVKKNSEWNEDDVKKLKNWVQKYGQSSWTNCAKYMNEKTPKNCREKWQLISKDDESIWSNLDEAYLLLSVNSYGTCWSKISKLFPTHPENSIKNKFYNILKRISFEKLSLNDNRINTNNLKLSELLIFLPTALNVYRQLIGEEVYNSLSQQFEKPSIQKCQSDIINFKNTNNSQINICSACKEKLKQIIKKNLISNILKKSFYEFSTDEMRDINNLEKLKNTSQKIDKLKEILNDVNKNILKFN
jgi:hypothetical protein